MRGGLNTYGYVLNNPLKYADPFGLARGKLTSEYRPCDDDDWIICEAQCKGRGIKKCDRLWYSKPVRVTQPGLKLYDWVKGPLSCICKESFCEKNTNTCAAGAAFGAILYTLGRAAAGCALGIFAN